MEEFFINLFDYLNDNYDIKENERNDSIKSDENSVIYMSMKMMMIMKKNK